jgi:DNA/RNA endonuclease YhcR with UshA esterase domain
MRTLLSILVVLTFAIRLPAVDTNAPTPSKTSTSALLKIGTADATNHYDEVMIVTGKVAQVSIRPTVTFLNLEKPFPNSPFTVVIFHGHSSFYGDANALKGKTIEIRGKIKNYHDKPEIALDNTN